MILKYGNQVKQDGDVMAKVKYPVQTQLNSICPSSKYTCTSGASNVVHVL